MSGRWPGWIQDTVSPKFRKGALARACLALCAIVASCSLSSEAEARPITTCDEQGVGSARLVADAPARILSASVEPLGTVGASYCLVKVRVDEAVNIWVGLPMGDRWNGRLQAEGGAGYAGQIAAPLRSVSAGFVGVQTDTGHGEPAGGMPDGRDPVLLNDWLVRTGAFAMRAPGVPNRTLQRDFAYRSVHLMAVIGRQLTRAFYGRGPDFAYWNGCSTGGRQGLRMAQDYPGDFDGILAGAPAINFGQLPAFQIWPQLVMHEQVGHPIPVPKLELATRAAIAACDTLDGVADGILTDPRRCAYRTSRDPSLTRDNCGADENDCLGPREAMAIDLIWAGPRRRDGSSLWPGIPRGAPLTTLAGPRPFPYAITQARYWVYLDPDWDWRTLNLVNYEQFFRRSVDAVNPLMGSNNPDLSAFRLHGGKIVMYHGFADGGILPQGSIRYYRSVAHRMRLSGPQERTFFRLFMLPGVGHCGGGVAPQPPIDQMLTSLMAWVEHRRAPDQFIARQSLPGGAERTRLLCPFPRAARYTGRGDSNRASSFVCSN